MTMPDGSGSAQEGRPPPDSGAVRRTVAFCLGALGIAAPQLATDRVLSWWGWVLLAVGCGIGGITGIQAMDAALARLLDRTDNRWNQPEFRARLRAPVLWILVLVVSFPLGMGVAGAVRWVRYVTGECPVTVPARVLTTPTMRGTVESLAERFQASTADSRGCLRYSVFVTALSQQQASTALGNGWKDDPSPERSDVARYGPRPDAYLPDSVLALAELGDVRSRVVRDVRVFASAAVTIALSPTAAATAAPEDLSGKGLADQIAALREIGIPLVRPAPELSQAGVLAHSIYSQDDGGGTSYGAGPDADPPKASLDLESRMLDDARKNGYPDGGERSLLEQYFGAGPLKQSVALLLTAPFAEHPELLLGHEQEAEGRLRTVPVLGPVNERPEVSLPFATLSFDTESGGTADLSRCGASDPAYRPSSCTAREFGTWLGTREGRRQIMSLDLIPCIGNSCTTDPLPGSERERETVAAARFARRIHEKVRSPRKVMVVMDASLSMGQRFREVAAAVGAELPPLLSQQDRLGLRIVGGSPGSKDTGGEVPLGRVSDGSEASGAGRVLRTTLADWRADGGSPMTEPLTEAIGSLREGPTTASRDMLLLVTDGSFALHLNDPEQQAEQLGHNASTSRVRVLALVTGSSTCPKELQDIVRASSGTCSPVQGPVTTELDKLMGGQ